MLAKTGFRCFCTGFQNDPVSGCRFCATQLPNLPARYQYLPTRAQSYSPPPCHALFNSPFLAPPELAVFAA